MKMETNYVLEYLKKINSLLGGRQKECHDRLMKHAKAVRCSPISEVLTAEQIELIKTNIRPRQKECFRNAQMVSIYIDGAEYVEGMYGFGGIIGIEHAFNKIGDKYFDITCELVLEKDVTKETYVSILEVNNKSDICLAQLDLNCYTNLIPYFALRGEYLK